MMTSFLPLAFQASRLPRRHLVGPQWEEEQEGGEARLSCDAETHSLTSLAIGIIWLLSGVKMAAGTNTLHTVKESILCPCLGKVHVPNTGMGRRGEHNSTAMLLSLLERAALTPYPKSMIHLSYPGEDSPARLPGILALCCHRISESERTALFPREPTRITSQRRYENFSDCWREVVFSAFLCTTLHTEAGIFPSNMGYV